MWTHAGEGEGQEGQRLWVQLWPWCGLIHGEGTALKRVDADFVLQRVQDVTGRGWGKMPGGGNGLCKGTEAIRTPW